ncbi:PBSX family phage terminase large subunit [Achromobacter xylosoxidans]|uniref:PBSX family phage terminase large subunit n=1 Tax=Alcaligenes xylosoxydans xylosoxydans TaxID=85698 RepID=UPI0011DCD531|nr:PBSX family phage terminase large subunit [Achromobacter xylosoxidans]WPQ34367.1 PBSX family phage terminase large subunit [Achromobacter xylosoxidans]
MELLPSRPTLNPALRDFWLKPARNRVLYGGRASSKSWDAAGFATFLANTYRLRFLCVRQFQNKIEESVYTLLKTQIERFGLNPQFRVLDNKIVSRKTKSEFLFYGLWRSIDEIKSLEGIDVLWIEEAHNLTEEQWKILEATIRKQGSQIWVIFNPKLSTDFAYKRFVTNPPPNTVVRKINYDENPFLSATMREVIEAAKAEDYDEYLHVYEGVPKDDDDDAIIKRSWLMAALDAHKALGLEITGRRRLGFDIADSGIDKCALLYAHGPLASWADLWKAGEDELLKSCTRAHGAARERHASITYDSIGVGAAAGAKFNEINAASPTAPRVSHSKFNAGGAVYRPDALYMPGTKNKDMFANIKAQAWWGVADRLRATFNAVRNGAKVKPEDMLILDSTMPHLSHLMDELCTPKRDYDKAGRVMVESKKDLAKREVPSPNLADALVMAYAPGAAPMNINPDALRRA